MLAESLDRFRAQLNALAPNRSKASDGTIGDQAHASRASDHNPRWIAGANLVTAFDATHDPANGLDCQRLALSLQRARDSRIQYVIWARRIMSGAAGPEPWAWRPYKGANPHTRHLPVSVVGDHRCRDSTPWMLPGIGARPDSPWPTIRRGDTGTAVGVIQRFLGVQPVSEFFGPATEAAVKKYQAMRGLEADGICGPATWTATGL
jgi:peptidoglycan hydrolase-like protein with peptidoglycan-binding domain